MDWLRALLNASPIYIAAGDENVGFLDVSDNSKRLRMIVIGALEKLEPEERAPLIASVIPETNDLSVLCEVFRSVAGDRRPEGVVRTRISAASSGDKTDMVREQLLASVRDLAATGAIWRQAVPRDIVFFWWGSILESYGQKLVTA
jgi:hypothetical protein